MDGFLGKIGGLVDFEFEMYLMCWNELLMPDLRRLALRFADSARRGLSP